MTISRSRLPLFALGAAASTLAMAFGVLSRPEAIIGAGFRDALANVKQAASEPVAVLANRSGSGDALDPRYLRQSSLPAGGIQTVLGPLKVGERIRLGSAGGAQDLEVIGLHPVRRTAGTEGHSGAGMVLVVLRADDETGSVVRLLVEETGEPSTTAATARRAL
jgi:hypothetical protein